MITIIIIIICVFVFYLGYSYQKNRKTNFVSKVYREFQSDYEDSGITAMGYAYNNSFTKDITIMLAINSKGKILDAQTVEERDMQMDVKTCTEYIGKNIHKYAEKNNITYDESRSEAEKKSIKEMAFDMAVKNLLEELQDE